jgi:hypothetical protein
MQRKGKVVPHLRRDEALESFLFGLCDRKEVRPDDLTCRSHSVSPNTKRSEQPRPLFS